MNIELCDDNFIFENLNKRKIKITIETMDDNGALTTEDFIIHVNNRDPSYYELNFPQGFNCIGPNAEKILQQLLNHPRVTIKEQNET